MAKFQVGEIALLWNPGAEYHKDDVLITGLPGAFGYAVEHSDGEFGFCTEEYLRKKRPPKESDDTRLTREKGAPSFTKMMEDLKKGRVPEVV